MILQVYVVVPVGVHSLQQLRRQFEWNSMVWGEPHHFQKQWSKASNPRIRMSLVIVIKMASKASRLATEGWSNTSALCGIFPIAQPWFNPGFYISHFRKISWSRAMDLHGWCFSSTQCLMVSRCSHLILNESGWKNISQKPQTSLFHWKFCPKNHFQLKDVPPFKWAWKITQKPKKNMVNYVPKALEIRQYPQKTVVFSNGHCPALDFSIKPRKCWKSTNPKQPAPWKVSPRHHLPSPVTPPLWTLAPRTRDLG